MENGTKEKHTNINPLLKIAIPIAFTIVGIIFSTLTKKSQQRSSNHETMSPYDETEEGSSSQEEVETIDYSDESETAPQPDVLLLESAREISVQCSEEPNIEEQMNDMKNHVTSIEDRHNALETQFYDYCNMKEQESTYQKLQIMCLGLKLELLEAQNKKFVDEIAEFRGTINQVDAMKTEFKSLEMNVKKLRRTTEVYSNNIAKEISRSNDDFSRVMNETKHVYDQVHREIKGVEEKLVIRTTYKMDEAEVQDNKHLFENLQQLKAQWSAEMQELIYVGWVNACLRREILVIEENELNGNTGAEDSEIDKARPVAKSLDEVVMELPDDEHAKSCRIEHYSAECSSANKDIEDIYADNKCSRKPRFISRIKGWAKGKEKCKSVCGVGKFSESRDGLNS